MNSKEAFNFVANHSTFSECNLTDYDKALEQLEEDTDILEIFAKHTVCINENIYLVGIKKDSKDHSKIKKWLERR